MPPEFIKRWHRFGKSVGPLVARRWDLYQGTESVGLLVPGGGQVWADG